MQIWHQTFNKTLKVLPEEHPVLLTEPPLNPKVNREKMIQIMFETFNMPALYIAIRPMLSLYSCDLLTGLALYSGDGVSHAVPIYEGHSLPHAIVSPKFGGQHLTEYLQRLFVERDGHPATAEVKPETFLEQKMNDCYVALDYQQERNNIASSFNSHHYVYIQCPEANFQPDVLHMGLESPGMHEACYRAIMKCDKDLHKDLYGNIALSGGNTRFPGFVERMKKEMTTLAPQMMEVNVIDPPDKNSAWSGGSKLASLSTFKHMWITKPEYDESGPAIIHKKCF